MKKSYKYLSIAAALAISINCTPFAFAASSSTLGYGDEYKNYGQGDAPKTATYSDVPSSHWAYDSIERCSAKQWFTGYVDGTFRPDASISRAEAMKVIVSFLGLTPSPISASSYSDVGNHWAAPYIEVGKGLLPVQNVMGQTPFRPDAPVTREDTMYAMVTALGYASLTSVTDQSLLQMFTDSNAISVNCKPYIVVGLQNKLISGFEDNTIRAQDPLTRAQFATLLAKASTVGFGPDGAWGNGSVTTNPTVTAAPATPGTPNTTIPTGNGIIRGNVISASDNSPIAGASVSANGVTAVTDSMGMYQLTVPNGNYTVSASATGYISGSVEVQANANTTTDASPISLVKEGVGNGIITGTVYNAFTGTGIAGAKILFFNQATNDEYTITADENGVYSISLPIGSYNARAVADNFIPQSKVVVAQADQSPTQDFTLSSVLADGHIRFVLTWGETPADLDSHLTGPSPSAEERFHICFWNKEFKDSSTLIADLDVDDITSYGPETITLFSQSDGTYRYSVHDYTNRNSENSTALSLSKAKVEIYKGGYLIKTYNVPANQPGNLWTVCEINGSDIKDICTMSSTSGSSDAAALFSNLGSAQAQSVDDSSVIVNAPHEK